MNNSTDFDDLEGALRRCGSNWSAAQTHGLLCGRLAVCGTDGAAAWRGQVLENLDSNDALRADCETLLDGLLQSTWQQLGERQSEFGLLLPDDDEAAALRTQAIADWCEGFLHGLVADQHSEPVRKRLAQEPLSDLIRDMLEITRAAVGDEDDDEENERAYVELVEYIRVAAQLAYEELADLRNGPPADGKTTETLH
jgi:uncharacterized protein YgfB (UPF0149 family)